MSDLEPQAPKAHIGETLEGTSKPLVDQTRSVRVVIADDNAYMREHLRTMLEADGITVVGEAENGVQAVDLFRREQPDAVIMDLVMPELDGYGAIAQIIEIDEDARIIVCSGMGSNDEVTKAITAGAIDFLVKPFQVERVAEVIRTVLPGVVGLTGPGTSAGA